ncbi:MAG: GTPase domain-containing protein [Promethearchaeota archaeon]
MDIQKITNSREVRKILLSTPYYKGTYRICIVGSTGSGKTSFLKMLLGSLFEPMGERKRRHTKETQTGSTYTILDPKLLDKESTTTVSLNVADILLLVTKYNTIEWFAPADVNEVLLREDIESLFHLLWIDSPGQERFDFMPQIVIPGSDAGIIFADGTNVESVVKLSYYIRLLRDEERKRDKPMPIAIFLNKKDLEGIYLGLEMVKNMFKSEKEEDFLFETSVLEEEGFEGPLRLVIDNLKPRDYTKILNRPKVKT